LKINVTRVLAAISLALAFAYAVAAYQAKLGDSNQELLKKADELYEAHRYREAIELYKEVVNRDPNNDHAIGRIGYAFNRLNDRESARQWMKRRVEIPGQSPSVKAQVLTDIALLYWDQADMEIATRQVSNKEDSAATDELLAEGIESAQKAIAIAPRSAKAFNLLNLLYRASASQETDQAKQKELIAKADEALRQAIKFFESLPQQQSADLMLAPTISMIKGVDYGQVVKLGAATKKPVPDAFRDAKGAQVVVELFIGRDGKVRLPRLIAGQGKLIEAALSAARNWEFEPTTFEGHPIQVIEIITFPAK
jgi:tetratricopeptide (TPR) repeat protein